MALLYCEFQVNHWRASFPTLTNGCNKPRGQCRGPIKLVFIMQQFNKVWTRVSLSNIAGSCCTWLSLFSSSSCLRSVSQRTNSQLSLSCSRRDCRPCGLSTDPTSSSPLPALFSDSIVRTWDMTSFRKTFGEDEEKNEWFLKLSWEDYENLIIWINHE